MNRKVCCKFIRAAGALLRSQGAVKSDVLPQDLSGLSDEQLALYCRVLTRELENLAVLDAKAFARGEDNGMTVTSKASKLLRCFRSGHIPNRI